MAVSACNRLDGEVVELTKGKATTNVTMSTDLGEITLVVTSSAVEVLELTLGDRVSAMFREVDVMLMAGNGLISTRNRFAAQVVEVRKGGVTAEIRLELDGGRRMLAVIARVAAEEMELVAGSSVTACVREGDLLLLKGAATSVRNGVEATITHLRPGTVTTEVTLATGSGDLFALLARSMADDMCLAIGDRVTALMRERDILVQSSDQASK